MAKLKVAIYDVEKGYRERFADYLMNYKANEMEVAVFTNEKFFCEALEVDKYHLLVLGCGYEEVLTKVSALKVPVLVLSEYVQNYVKESVGTADMQIMYTSKYQSMDVITRQMQLMTEKKWQKKEVSFIGRELEVVGIFSPVRHELQMMFSLLYAKNAARTGKVLYINLMEFSGFSEMFGKTEYDLGDAVLQIRQDCIKPERLLPCIYEMEDFSYISPFTNPENVREITGEDIRRLIDVLTEYTEYQIIVLDMGMNVMELAEALMVCSKIFCLGKTGYLFQTQMKQFFSYLEKMVDEAFLERIEQIEIPCQAKVICGGANLLEQLDWGELGDFVRTKI